MKKTEQSCIEEIKDFYTKTGDWPRAQDIPALSKLLQRRFGGLVEFRKRNNLGYSDYTKGSYRSEVSKVFNKLGYDEENKLFEFLSEKYGRVNVHREYLIGCDSRKRADFGIFIDDKEAFLVDCFFPKDLHSLKGCLAAKSRKYRNYTYSPVVLIQLNNKISDSDLEYVVYKKKVPLKDNQKVMSLNNFMLYNINTHDSL